MREILFKAKRVDDERWEIGDYVKEIRWIYIDEQYVRVERHYICVNMVSSEEQYIAKAEVIPETICQYTGLTDKNGNKIWENDIVKQSFYKFLENEIESEEISGCEIGVVGIIPTKGTCMKNPLQYVEVNGEIEKNFEKTKMYKGVCQYRCEIIGNIFDNPELLEGGAE